MKISAFGERRLWFRCMENALAGEEVFVGEDAVEGGAADGELAGGTELVAAVEVEDELDMMVDDGVEGKVGGTGGRLRVKQRDGAGRGAGPGID